MKKSGYYAAPVLKGILMNVHFTHPSRERSPQAFLAWLTEPHPSALNQDVRRRIRLLLGMALVLLLGNVISIICIYALIPESAEWLLFFSLPCIFSLCCALGGYWLGKTPHFKFGVLLTSMGLIIVSYGSVLTTNTVEGVPYPVVSFAGVIVSGLFFTVRHTAWVALMNFIGLPLLFYVHDMIAPLLYGENARLTPVFIVAVWMIAIGGVSVCLLIFMRLRDLMEEDRLLERQRALEQEQIAESYRRANDLKAAFLASMSHELRTPLNAIINFPSFVMNGEFGAVNDQQKEVLGYTVDSAKHLLNLINDVLDMSKIEAGMLKLYMKDGVYVNEVIWRAAAIAPSLLEGKPVRVVVQMTETLPSICADEQRVYQVLLNILSNACKFTEAGEIRIMASAHSDHIQIAIADTGPGIMPEEHEAVFEAFRQTESGRQRGGTGLGMPISKRLVEAHCGKLWLDSTPGKGTTFFVSLPIQPMPLSEGYAG